METVKITRMTQNDVDEVFNIEKLVHPNHHWSKDSFYNELANNLAFYYSAKNSDNKILAFLGCWHILEEAHITTLAVHPDYRRMQIAETIMIQAINDCYDKKIKYITLEVRESNQAAISLYEKFSFESIGVRKRYYQDNGENAIIMFTQNIWYDKFKNNFSKIKEGVKKIEVTYDE